jgi:multiple sugar transport system substrate-binding protein
VSRSVLWFSLTGMVSSQSQAPEAAYLLLQWLGSARIYAWMSANPGGYLDPFRLSDFNDPLVQETYHAYHIAVLRETVARTVPTINYPGATAFHNALDENLMAALTGAKTSEQAMADTASEWERIVRRTGQEKIAEAIQASRPAWPTIIDPLS